MPNITKIFLNHFQSHCASGLLLRSMDGAPPPRKTPIHLHASTKQAAINRSRESRAREQAISSELVIKRNQSNFIKAPRGLLLGLSSTIQSSTITMAPSQDIEEASDGSIRIEPWDEPTRRPCFSRKKKIMMTVFSVAVVSVILGVFMSKAKTTVRSANQLSAGSPYGQIDEGSNDHEENSEELGNSISTSEDGTDIASVPKKEVTDFDAITIYDGPLPASFSSRSGNLYRLVCEDNEILTTLDLVTDGYAWETSWEINRADGTQLAFGPPTGSKYQRMTSYKGELCLPVGRNVLVMYDSAGDGKFVPCSVSLFENFPNPTLIICYLYRLVLCLWQR